MQNEAGENVDLYIPRKCSATNQILAANDHAAVQFNVCQVDQHGRMTGKNKTYALCGYVRRRGEADDCMNRLCKKDGILPKNF